MPLSSMTGFGEAQAEREDHAITIEVRSVNSRHLKLNTRLTEGYGSLESQVEAVAREYVRRGTVYINVRMRHIRAADDYRVNVDVLHNYLDVLQLVAAKRDLPEELRVEPLAVLPGVVEELSSEATDAKAAWPMIEPTLRDAFSELTHMRSSEGEALAKDLSAQCDAVEFCLGGIEERAPSVAENYRQKLLERVSETLVELNSTLEPGDLVREVCLFADRSDISEETVRLRSHISQFRRAINEADSPGKKLEFICQEMGRETNTIGSKASDSLISEQVVEIKTALERIREQIQNVE